MQAKIQFSGSRKDCLSVAFMFEGMMRPFEAMPESFTGKKLESFYLPEHKVIVVGLGKEEELKIDYYRRAAAKAVKLAMAYKIAEVQFPDKGLDGNSFGKKEFLALAEGSLLANYSFDKYKAEDAKPSRVKEIILPETAKGFRESIESAAVVCENVSMVRDLVSENSDIVTPDFIDGFSRKIAKECGLKIEVLEKAELEKLGMNCLLAVGRASTQSPRLIMLEYNGDPSSNEKIMLAGKGMCFDSGGLDIKPRDSMLEMRMDMAGAATVLAIMKSASELKLKKNIVGIMAVTENLVDAKSYRPKDIIKSYSGKTVENMDTDAEGRLVLADALNYGAKKFGPKLIMEFSTLTGSIVSTFGSHVAGLFANSAAKEKGFEKKMSEAGLETYERVWELPLFEEYLDEVSGERSDFRSLGKTRYNGAIFGAAFLSKFVEDKPFLHIDIAGTAHIEEAKDYMPKDGTGFGVRLAVEFLKKI
ncbi:cytosol aminopeptidase [uncultured archaeon]|nr:cytosol aminopeptidase [uncultured archaeon]